VISVKFHSNTEHSLTLMDILHYNCPQINIHGETECGDPGLNPRFHIKRLHNQTT